MGVSAWSLAVSLPPCHRSEPDSNWHMDGSKPGTSPPEAAADSRLYPVALRYEDSSDFGNYGCGDLKNVLTQVSSAPRPQGYPFGSGLPLL